MPVVNAALEDFSAFGPVAGLVTVDWFTETAVLDLLTIVLLADLLSFFVGFAFFVSLAVMRVTLAFDGLATIISQLKSLLRQTVKP